MVKDFNTTLDEVKNDKSRLPLADDLSTEEGMRKVIQALKLLVEDLRGRIETLEKK